MNLAHLAAKRDKNLFLGSAVIQAKATHRGHTYTGFRLPVGTEGEVRIKTALKWYPLNTRPASADWLGAADQEGGLISTAFVAPDGTIVSELQEPVIGTATALHLPFLPAPADHVWQTTLDLVVRNVSPSGTPVDLLVTETVPTEPFYDQAQGLGVEIGPGPNPRILPREGRQVFYVERETAEEFKAKYDFKGKFESLDSPEARAFWDQVIVGRANHLPFEDGSLDFIFSADVVEHLVNPLGHFAYWRSKLKSGGRVLAIIPHISGCGDYVNRPTALASWISEYKRGGFEETVDHHAPFALARNIDPASLLARGYSSHFSFFNTENLTQALEFCVARLGYKGFNVYHGRNAKKIHFALYA